MNATEAGQILTVLKAAYPDSFKSLSKRDGIAMIDLWAGMFADDDYGTVNAAVKALIATRKVGYSPTVGEVKEKIQSLRTAQGLSEQAAWAMVSKACQNGLYGYQKEFEKLPPEVQRAVGAPEQLKAWAAMDTEAVESVVASNFMRNFRAQTAREKENAMLPGEIRQMISGIADGMKMIGGEKDGNKLPLQEM